jgi:hypothetical protein
MCVYLRLVLYQPHRIDPTGHFDCPPWLQGTCQIVQNVITFVVNSVEELSTKYNPCGMSADSNCGIGYASPASRPSIMLGEPLIEEFPGAYVPDCPHSFIRLAIR